MAVTTRNRYYSQQRLTVPIAKAIESAASADWDSFLRNVMIGTTQPYIVQGFSVNIGSAAFTQTAGNLTLNSANGVILDNTAVESGTLLAVTGSAAEVLNSSNPNIIGSFVAGSTNYIALNYIRQANPNSVDTVYIFDKNSNQEVPKQLPIFTTLSYQIVITQNGFGTNVPIAAVITNPSNIPTSIVDSRYLLFRLGTGGSSPNIFNSYSWPQGRVEPPTISTSSNQNPFSGGDKGILNFKNWMDAIMSSLKEIKGTPYWYSIGSGGGSTGLSLNTVNNDANQSFWTGSGTLMHDPSVAGQLDSSADIYIRSTYSDSYFRVQSFTKSMSAGQVTWVSLNRYQTLSGNATIVPASIPSPSALNTLVGGNTGYVIQASSVGQYTGLNSISASSDGDWIRAENDSDRYFRQINAFYDNTGALTTPSNATYIALDSPYNITGATTGSQALEYNTCYYANTAVTVTSKVNTTLTAQIQNIIWLANYPSPNIYVHGNVGYLAQGESKNVNDPVSQNLLNFVGATETANNPTYNSTINGAITTTSQVNYGGTSTDNLSVRTSLLTTAASDQAQNKNISLYGGGTISNSSGNLIWNASITVIINGPGAGITNYIAANTPTGISLAQGTCLYVTIQRDTNGASLNISNTAYSSVPLNENTFVIAKAAPTTSDMLVGLGAGAYLITTGTASSSGINPSAPASNGVANIHKWRQEKPSVNLAPINSVNTSFTPYSPLSLLVFRNGLIQSSGVDYNFVNQTATFTYNLLSTDEIVLQYPVGKTIQYTYQQEVPQAISVTSGGWPTSNTSFTFSTSIGNVRGGCVFLNGLQRQYGTDFTISGQTITFNFGVSTTNTAYIFYCSSNDTLYGDQGLLGGTANGTQQLFTYYEDLTSGNEPIVSVNGVCQFPVNNTLGTSAFVVRDYQWLNENGLVFNSTGWAGAAPPSNSILYLYGR